MDISERDESTKGPTVSLATNASAASDKHTSCEHGSKLGGPILGPAPCLSIIPARLKDLPAFEHRKMILLRRKVRLYQSRLLTVYDPAAKGRVENDDKAQLETDANSTLMTPFTGYEVNWILDDACLIRYLKAREWHVEKALMLLLESVAFRRSKKPERLKPKLIQPLGTRGQIFRHGFDKLGNPIIVIRAALNLRKEECDNSIDIFIYTLERTIQSIDRTRQNDQITFFVDYTNYTNENQPSVKMALKFLDIFQNFYPERLCKAFLIDTPWYFQTFWNIIYPFIPSKTTAKIKFIRTDNADDLKQLFSLIPNSFLQIEGGKVTKQYSYDSKLYWEEEHRQYECLMKFLQEKYIKNTQEQRVSEIMAAWQAEGGMKAGLQEALEASNQCNAQDAKTESELLEGNVKEEEEALVDEAKNGSGVDSQAILEEELKREALKKALDEGTANEDSVNPPT